MNRYHTPKPDDEDALLNGSLSEADADEASFANSDELRLARIDEYQHDSLRKIDSGEACLGGFNGGLMKIALRTEQAILKAIETAGDNILETPAIQRAMATHLSLTRQVDRVFNLQARLAESRRQAESAKSERRLSAGQRRVTANNRLR
jgi:hypothetical protein